MFVLKDALYLVRPMFFRGVGKEFQPDKYLTDTGQYYPSHACYKLILFDLR